MTSGHLRDASAADGEMNSRSDLRLTARYRWLLIGVVLPLFVVIAVLAINQYRDQREQVIHGLVQNTTSYSIALDGIAKLASDHVLQMQAWSENYLRSPPAYPSDLRGYYRPRFINGTLDGYTLDEVPEDERKYIGQLAWLGGDPRQTEVGEVALDQALEFFSVARLAHDVTPYFQWSYFFSAANGSVSIYPWFSANDIVKAGDYTSLKAALTDWFRYEIYLAGTPEKNSQRKPYWTAPYLDAGGTGTMVSHGTPVYLGDEFVGIVGTDLRLATLESFLKGLPMDVGRLMVMDNHNMLLADTAGSPENAIEKVADVLPEDITWERFTRALHAVDNSIDTGGHVFVARETTHAPWTLIYLVGDEEISGLLLPRLMPYAVIIVALTATVLAALYLLRREFIGPALTLVKYIRDISQDPSVAEPRLPRLWRTWTNVVSQAFTRNLDVTRKLRESEERLQQVLNNSSAVVYVRDREERFLLVNRAFERLLGLAGHDVVGKKLEEIFTPETAAEFRANDMRVIDQNSVMEFEENVALNDGVHTYISSKFPLFDMEGEIYAICGISTDITQRKQTEEILRQAALGISEAQGEEVFNSLVMHLSQAIGTDYAFIGVLEPEDRIRTRALCVRGKIEDNITYSLEGSPCRNVVGQQFRFYPSRIQQRFPKDVLLQEIGVESYAAIPLFGSAGEVLGLMAVLHSQPLQDEAQIESILQIFAGRAASELERERADRRLRDSEAFKSAILENALLAVITIDHEGRIVEFNSAAVAMFGQDKKRAIGSSLADLIIPQQYRAAHQDGMTRYLETGEGHALGKRLELTALRAGGSEFPVELSISVNRIGDADYFTAFIADLTDKKDAEEALRTSEEQYRSIFNAASDAMILWDAKGKMVDVNPAAWKMGGYTKDEFLKKPFDEHIHPSSIESYEKFKHDVATVKAAATETKAIKKDGTVIDLESRSIPMPYRGQPHILTVTRDITEQKRAAEELARQREALRQSEKLSAMGELLAGVAHELNNPLAILMGRAALLEDKTTDPIVQPEVGKIRTAAERCGRIVRTFLAMARQKPPECRAASLNDVVTSAIDLMGYGLRTSGVELETHLANALPEPNMDVDQIGQIVVNLLVNAQHALTDRPQPRRITIETGQSGNGVACRIADNGSGVPVELQQRIFDPFFTTKNGSVGTGVGLSVSRSIAREHGGELRLESTPEGATFELWLPLDSACGKTETVENQAAMDEVQADHVLIVDDEPEVAELLEEILQSAGLKTTKMHSGKDAMKWLEEHTCDLILCDVRMPDLDGPALWRTLKTQNPGLAQRMAFITGDTLSASIAPFLKESGLPWLEKPFTPEQVLELVARVDVG